jgi:cytidine deaminase
VNLSSQVNSRVLFERAGNARTQAYAPYSGFAVGAAILTSTGQIFCGCNVENISLGLTICAERCAAAAAIQAGERVFVAIAIVADSNVPVVPCGACRQFLAEFNGSLTVYSATLGGSENVWPLDWLLPSPSEGILPARGGL